MNTLQLVMQKEGASCYTFEVINGNNVIATIKVVKELSDDNELEVRKYKGFLMHTDLCEILDNITGIISEIDDSKIAVQSN